jgi:large subunit ribosomal protein L18e
MTSKTGIGKRVKRKTHPEIVTTLISAKNASPWRTIAQRLSGSRRNYPSVNLEFIEHHSKEGDTIVVPGKVLGSGALHKKVRICAMSFSESARVKVKQAKAELVHLSEEIKKNPKAEGIKVLP